MIYNSTIKSAEFLLSDLKFYQAVNIKEGNGQNGENMTEQQKEKLIKDIEIIINDIKI